MPPRFRAACALAASTAVFALAGPALPAAAANGAAAAKAAAAANAAAKGEAPLAAAVIGSGRLAVAVAQDFPRVVSYTDRASGAALLAPGAKATATGVAARADGETEGQAPFQAV